jgi:hypothetical protein
MPASIMALIFSLKGDKRVQSEAGQSFERIAGTKK